VADRAHAAGAFHDRQRGLERPVLDQLLQPAMREEEAGVEVQHALPHRREAKVPGLDDPRVDGADRQLVDTLAVDFERDVVPVAGRRSDIGRHVLAERVIAGRPAFVEHQAARVGVSDRHDPQEVLALALIPQCGRHDARDARVRRVGKRQVSPQAQSTADGGEDHLDGQPVAAD